MLRRFRGDGVFSGRETVGAELTIGIRRDGFRLRAGDGYRDARERGGFEAALPVRLRTSDETEHGGAGRGLGERFHPANIGVVGGIRYFVSPRAAACTESVGRGIAINHVVVPFR